VIELQQSDHAMNDLYGKPRRPISGALIAVFTSLACPLTLIMLASFPTDTLGESDAYIRGIIGVVSMLPLFTLLLVIYHGLVTVAALFVPIRMLILVVVLPLIGSIATAAAIMATGAPLTWGRFGDLIAFAGVLCAPLALGAMAHYYVSFKPRSLGTTN
jgi:hypothetical protein